MRNEFFNGYGRTSQQPYTEIVEYDVSVIDYYGRVRNIPAGSKCKHFETTNKGWIIWEEPDGTKHLTDVG